ncbi:MAG: type IV toxin-antitoxin system AbiEi family antitoxin domain-containing protein, partial [Nanoarchaeota archaeon]|nr:type IV toxin-antitoxin system AbiEi family antitoxin domain-containing protein [Nanoarchaeota archaeon]
DSKLQLEAIKRNKTGLRCGKITARWVLLIYANNVNKFIEQVGFISKRKIAITKDMEKIKGNNPQYSTLKIIKLIQDEKGFFCRKDFIKKMKSIGYKSPSCYLWRYHKKGIIRRIRPGYYKVLF